MIFDSDVLIWFLRQEPDAVSLIEAHTDRAVSIVTLMEAIQGSRSKAHMRTILDLFAASGFRILPLSEPIGNLAAGLIEEHTLAHGLQMPDADRGNSDRSRRGSRHRQHSALPTHPLASIETVSPASGLALALAAL